MSHLKIQIYCYKIVGKRYNFSEIEDVHHFYQLLSVLTDIPPVFKQITNWIFSGANIKTQKLSQLNTYRPVSVLIFFQKARDDYLIIVFNIPKNMDILWIQMWFSGKKHTTERTLIFRIGKMIYLDRPHLCYVSGCHQDKVSHQHTIMMVWGD